MSNEEQTVRIGSTVKLIEHGTDDEEVFYIVESSNADLLESKISVDNPMSQALLGKKAGDEVSLSGPNGEVKFSVLEVRNGREALTAEANDPPPQPRTQEHTMKQAQNGNTVTINYIGRLDNGSVFDSTDNRQPFQFVLGQGRVIQGFEQAVLGMRAGESKTVKLLPEDAYGPRSDEMVVSIERASFPQGAEPQVGQSLEFQQPDGSPIRAKVTEVTESRVTVDANHPLAGEALTFEISLLEVA